MQVLLGRSTDFTVDIDLGREGLDNKISRRQVSGSLVYYFLSLETSVFSIKMYLPTCITQKWYLVRLSRLCRSVIQR